MYIYSFHYSPISLTIFPSFFQDHQFCPAKRKKKREQPEFTTQLSSLSMASLPSAPVDQNTRSK